MTKEEALQIARDVIDGKSRSYVSAAISLAKYMVETEERVVAQLAANGVPAPRDTLPYLSEAPPDSPPQRQAFVARRGESPLEFAPQEAPTKSEARATGQRPKLSLDESGKERHEVAEPIATTYAVVPSADGASGEGTRFVEAPVSETGECPIAKALGDDQAWADDYE